MIRLPTFPEPLHTYSTSLDGIEYRLKFDYSQRADRWYLSVYDALGEPIRVGIKLVPSIDLARLCRADSRAPKQVLIALDMTDTFSANAPGLFDLGRRITLWYNGEP